MDLITKIKPGLFLGSAKHITNSSELDKLNINVIINCCDEIEHELSMKYVIEHFPINDDGLDNSFVKYMDQAVDKINYYLSQNLNVFVHCVQGISRSAAIIIYYLMRYEKVSFNKAYYRLVISRPCILPNITFVKELKKKDIYANSDSDEFFKNKFSDLQI
ncbi:hypothetical protein QJ856_gp0690 [Tupanvirus deep ocean]|uniref:Uncharacterized protein n=2 Tax=Tupanvirus TaxID=2094720 RepID=A0AC62A8F7_9VIRU|nr:hypothetical protein QJ856_gp0690 [Tupanvirus deep ocean]QKU34061.1 hypothetical protein [Tupanvirus deep ocean]